MKKIRWHFLKLPFRWGVIAYYIDYQGNKKFVKFIADPDSYKPRIFNTIIDAKEAILSKNYKINFYK